MTKLMTEIITIKTDPETKAKLEKLSEGSDMSKILRSLILREWDVQHDSIRVPLVGTIGKTGSYNGHTVIDPETQIEIRQGGIE
jgi:hypothetical protein